MNQFSDVVFPFEIGETYEGRPINAYLIMEVEESKRGSVKDMEEEILSRPGFLMDAAHHTREYTTIAMCVFTMMRVLLAYE